MALRGETAAIVESRHSRIAPLGAGETFTGAPAIDMERLVAVVVGVLADQAGTVYVDSSPDSTNWDWSVSLAVSANVQATLRASPPYAFARVRFTNGSTPQTSMRLQTSLRMAGGVGSEGDNATETTLATLSGNVASGAAKFQAVDTGGTALSLPANTFETLQKQVSNSSVTVAASSTAYNRGMILEAPTGNDQTIWVTLGAAAVSGKGIEMKAGKTVTFLPGELQDAQKINAIAAAASTTAVLNVTGLSRV